MPRGRIARERIRHKWTAEEDAALRWLAERYSIADLQVILCRPMGRIEQRLLRLDIEHSAIEHLRRDYQPPRTILQRLLRLVRFVLIATVVAAAFVAFALWLGSL